MSEAQQLTPEQCLLEQEKKAAQVVECLSQIQGSFEFDHNPTSQYIRGYLQGIRVALRKLDL